MWWIWKNAVAYCILVIQIPLTVQNTHTRWCGCFVRKSYRRYITRSVRNGYHWKKSLLSVDKKDFFRGGVRGIWTLAWLLTTYSLSRGAPSASWVSLRINKYNISLLPKYSSIGRFVCQVKMQNWRINPLMYEKTISMHKQDDRFQLISLTSP